MSDPTTIAFDEYQGRETLALLADGKPLQITHVPGEIVRALIARIRRSSPVPVYTGYRRMDGGERYTVAVWPAREGA